MLNLRWIASALLTLCIAIGMESPATELIGVNEASAQADKIQNSGAIISVQKQPVSENNKQSINAKKCFFCIFIQVNGKIKED